MPHGGFQPNPFLNDPIRGLLDEDPQMAFLAHLQQLQLPQGQQRFLRGRFGDVFSQFQGALGHQIQSGEFPDLSFAQQFLPQFDLNRFRFQFSPQTRGEGTNRLFGKTRFL